MSENTAPEQPAPKAEPQRVEIWCHAPGANEVFLAGDFNKWDPKATKMTKVGENWKVKISVVPGFYSYNFVIDGKWVCDPNHMHAHDPPPCNVLTTHWLG